MAIVAQAANVPSWASTAIQTSDSAAADHGSHQLVYATSARFLSEGRVEVTIRSVAQISRNTQGDLFHVGFDHLPWENSIKSAAAWVFQADKGFLKSYSARAFVDSAQTFDGYTWELRRSLHFGRLAEVPENGFLAWEVTFESEPPLGEIAESLSAGSVACRERSFEIIPAPNSHLSWWASAPELQRPTVGSEPGALAWTIQSQKADTGPFPSAFQANPLMVFCYNLMNSPNAEIPSWSDAAHVVAPLGDFAISSSSPMVAKAKKLVAGKSRRWDRIRALCEFVQSEITYLEFTLERDELAGVRPHPPEQVLRDRYGDCKDKAALLVAMLKAIGEPAYAVAITSGNPSLHSPTHATLKFNHAIVAVPSDADVPATWATAKAGQSELVLFDPTDRTVPLGVLPVADESGIGLVESTSGPAMIRLPASSPRTSFLTRVTTGTLTAGMGFVGTVQETRYGTLAANEQADRIRNTEDGFRAQLDARVVGQNPQSTIANLTQDWDPQTCCLKLAFSVTVENYARYFSDRTIIFSPKIASRMHPPAAWTTSTEGTVYGLGEATDEIARITIPKSFTVPNLPSDWTAESQIAKGRVTYAFEGNTLIYRETFEQKSTIMERSDYDQLRSFYIKLSEKSRRPIFLKLAVSTTDTPQPVSNSSEPTGERKPSAGEPGS